MYNNHSVHWSPSGLEGAGCCCEDSLFGKPHYRASWSPCRIQIWNIQSFKRSGIISSFLSFVLTHKRTHTVSKQHQLITNFLILIKLRHCNTGVIWLLLSRCFFFNFHLHHMVTGQIYHVRWVGDTVVTLSTALCMTRWANINPHRIMRVSCKWRHSHMTCLEKCKCIQVCDKVLTVCWNLQSKSLWYWHQGEKNTIQHLLQKPTRDCFCNLDMLRINIRFWLSAEKCSI